MNALIAFYEKKSLLNLLKITKNLAKTSSKKYWHITRNHFSYMGRLLRRQYKQFMYNALIFVSTWESQQSTRETIIIFLAVHQNIPFIRTSPQKNYKKKKRIPKIFYFFFALLSNKFSIRYICCSCCIQKTNEIKNCKHFNVPKLNWIKTKRR